MKRFVILAILSLTLVSCGERDVRIGSSAKVINGNAFVPIRHLEHFEAVVRLINARGGTCTGTFLSPTILVTAAHCVTTSDKRTLGSVSVFGHDSQKVWVDPRYDGNDVSTIRKKYDLALVNFDPSLTQGLDINHFPRVGKAPKVGARVYLAGFGRRHKGGPTGTFSWGANKISLSTGTNLFVEGDQEASLKAMDAVPDAGDSGGPMFDLVWKIVGTVRGGHWNGTVKSEDFVRLDGGLFRSLFSDAKNF